MAPDIKEHVPLGPLTTLNIGGSADFFAEPQTPEEMVEALEFAKSRKLPVFIMGGGSNILISDEGFRGLVIDNDIRGIRAEKKGDCVIVSAGAGESWGSFVKHTVENGWAGVECLSGIPGKVGAAPVQNIGAYGQEASQVIVSVTAIDRNTLETKIFSKEECGFRYRQSIFNSSEEGKYAIVEVVFELRPGGEPTLLYQDLKQYFEGKPKPSLRDVHAAVLEIRAKKGMVIDPQFESYKSAGSFFKNVVVDAGAFAKIKTIVESEDPAAKGWFWPQPDGRVKVSAAKLIELSGFKKGYRDGEAGISPKHALSLINLGSAKAADIIALAKKIISGVEGKFGAKIEPEVIMVGFDWNPFQS